MTPDLASIIDEQEAEIGRLVAELAVVRRDWQADVGTLMARAQTAEARATQADWRIVQLVKDLDAARAEAARLREIIVQHDTSLFDNCAAQKRDGDCANEGVCDSCPRQWMIDADLRGPAQSDDAGRAPAGGER